MIILHLSEVHHQLQMMRQGDIYTYIYIFICTYYTSVSFGGMKIQLLISDFWIFWICNAFGICKACDIDARLQALQCESSEAI